MGKYSSLINRVTVFLEVGQSNMNGRGYYPENGNGQNGTIDANYNINGTNSDMQIYYAATWDTSKSGAWANYNLFVNNVNPESIALGSIQGGSGAFLKEMSDYKSGTVALIKVAQDGTSLWDDWQSGGSTYLNAKAWIEDAMEKVIELGIPTVKAVSFCQGFSDSDTLAHANAYEANLDDLITRINNVISGYVPFSGIWLIQQSPDWVNKYSVRPEANQAIVREAQATVGASGSNLYIDNSTVNVWSGDDVHYEASTYISLGVARFNLLKDL